MCVGSVVQLHVRRHQFNVLCVRRLLLCRQICPGTSWLLILIESEVNVGVNE